MNNSTCPICRARLSDAALKAPLWRACDHVQHGQALALIALPLHRTVSCLDCVSSAKPWPPPGAPLCATCLLGCVAHVLGEVSRVLAPEDRAVAVYPPDLIPLLADAALGASH